MPPDRNGAALVASNMTLILVSSRCRGFECESYILGLFGADGYRLRITRTVKFMPGDYCIGTRGKSLQVEFPVLIGNLKLWIRKDRHVSLHPRVYVALYGDSDFFPRERLFDGRRA